MLASTRPAVRPVSNAVLLALLAGCSTMPPSTFPEHVDHEFAHDYRIAADGKMPFPVTTRDLVVRELQLTPPPIAERFGKGQPGETPRWFLYPPGTTVTVQGKVRLYGTNAAGYPDNLGEIFRLPDGRGPLRSGDAERRE